jgi:hypothetical protein
LERPWNRGNRVPTLLALGAFADDAGYSEPPNLQLYRGARRQLL